jgi:hypothetical protein
MKTRFDSACKKENKTAMSARLSEQIPTTAMLNSLNEKIPLGNTTVVSRPSPHKLSTPEQLQQYKNF